MPILEADPQKKWFTMPLASGSLRSLRAELDEEDLAVILHDIAEGLSVAHEASCIHRDVTPQNILALPQQSARKGRRWVIADWGLVRQPENQVSRRLTQSNDWIGTYGFMAPEVFLDGHAATPRSDVYSLARVAAWFIKREEPEINIDLLPDGNMQHWRAFVKKCTSYQPSRRPANMKAVQEELLGVFAGTSPPAIENMRNLVDEIIIQDHGDIREVFSIALNNSADGPLYIDHFARLPAEHLKAWANHSPTQAFEAAETMLHHLGSIPWEDRSKEYANTPLGFAYEILIALTSQGHLGPAEDLATEFFRCEIQWNIWRQKVRTEAWLAAIEHPADAVVARALRAAGAVAYHGQPSTWQAKSPLIKAALLLVDDTN
jgi:eukaryotic-like serine/threonine-protein kinase